MNRPAAFLLSLIAFVVFVSASQAQTTAFTYQGNLVTSGSPANANHDFEFALFDSPTGGAQLGSTLTRTNVAVTNGVFAVSLDYGGEFLSGEFIPRFLEVRVRPSGAGPFTTLNPRQQIVSTPYASRSINSGSLGGFPASQYVRSDSGPISAGSHFSIGGVAVLRVQGGNSTFVGFNTGESNTGTDNSFFGNSAGRFNTSGESNSFFGSSAGFQNTTGSRNSFFGQFSGSSNTVGNNNSFLGNRAGAANTSGSGNAFFGNIAGENNTTGVSNSFFGQAAGRSNTTANSNSFFGSGAGDSNTTGNSNSFFGANAGQDNIIGTFNSFFGFQAGFSNLGNRNSFFGTFAGNRTSTGEDNSFFGFNAGFQNSTGGRNTYVGNRAGEGSAFIGTGGDNSFFGNLAGRDNRNGNGNVFLGAQSGTNFTAGTGNTYVGTFSGEANTTGNNNSYFGFETDGISNTLTNATAIGARAFVAQSNSLILGSINGVNGATEDTNVGIGTTAPTNLLTIGPPEPTVVSGKVGIFSPTGTNLIMRDTTNDVEGVFGVNSSTGVLFGSMTNNNVNFRTNNTIRMLIDTSGNIGIGTTAPTNLLTVGLPETTVVSGRVGIFSPTGTNIILRETTADVEGVMGVNSGGVIYGSMTDSNVSFRTNNTTRLLIDGSGNAIFSGIVTMNSFTAVTLDTGGTTSICRNASNRLATCSSSARYKSNINNFASGLDIIRRLRPVTFNWKEGGMRDLGLVAEEVAEVEPLLTTTNEKGEVEGVKYDRVGVVLVNAVKEQQDQIENLRKTVETQQKQIEALKKLLCVSNATAEICKERE